MRSSSEELLSAELSLAWGSLEGPEFLPLAAGFFLRPAVDVGVGVPIFRLACFLPAPELLAVFVAMGSDCCWSLLLAKGSVSFSMSLGFSSFSSFSETRGFSSSCLTLGCSSSSAGWRSLAFSWRPSCLSGLLSSSENSRSCLSAGSTILMGSSSSDPDLKSYMSLAPLQEAAGDFWCDACCRRPLDPAEVLVYFTLGRCLGGGGGGGAEADSVLVVGVGVGGAVGVGVAVGVEVAVGVGVGVGVLTISSSSICTGSVLESGRREEVLLAMANSAFLGLPTLVCLGGSFLGCSSFLACSACGCVGFLPGFLAAVCLEGAEGEAEVAAAAAAGTAGVASTLAFLACCTVFLGALAASSHAASCSDGLSFSLSLSGCFSGSFSGSFSGAFSFGGSGEGRTRFTAGGLPGFRLAITLTAAARDLVLTFSDMEDLSTPSLSRSSPLGSRLSKPWILMSRLLSILLMARALPSS